MKPDTVKSVAIGILTAGFIPLSIALINLRVDVSVLQSETTRGMTILEEMIPRLDKSIALLEQSVKINTDALEKLEADTSSK